ncbi:MAG: hypothetical protein Q9166_007656 [cf. Caloplaca sp. 2 TL-2023]
MRTETHDRYTRLLRRLCDQTGTAHFIEDCLQGLPVVVSKICSLDMNKSYLHQPDLDMFAYAIVVYTWLLVCKKRLHGGFPSEEERLHIRWAAYFLSTIQILNDDVQDLDYEHLAFAVCHWEKRSFKRQRNIWARDTWFAAIDMDGVDAPCYRNEEATMYLGLLRDRHIEGLTEFIVRREVEINQSAMRKIPNAEAYRGILAMMVSIDPDLLNAMIEGQIARKAEIIGTSISNRLTSMMNDQNPPPSIYQNAICDEEGNSPTPFQWFKILELMHLYIDGSKRGDEFAMAVDQIVHRSDAWPVTNDPFARRLHRYTDEHCDVPSSQRRRVIRNFTTQLADRLNAEVDRARLHVPLAAPVLEIGFSNGVRKRLRQHRKHRNSNYIMNLAEALFKHQYPKMFCLKQHIIYNCWSADQPWPSEILLTRLGQGYVANGGGFSHYPAGHSNGRSWERRSMNDWVRFEGRMAKEIGFWARLEAVRQRAISQAEDREKQEEIEYCTDGIGMLGRLFNSIAEVELARCILMQGNSSDRN